MPGRGQGVALVALTLLAACGGSPDQSASLVAANKAHQVECRVGDGGPMKRDCALEWRGPDEAGRHVLVIRRAQGGFRRLLLGTDGRLGQADGAEPLRLVRQDDIVSEVAIGQDRFRLTRQQLEQVK